MTHHHHPVDPDLVHAHTTAAAGSVARWLERHFGLQVQECHLIRRGLNDNYAVRTASGARHVARLYAIRPRGAFNVAFETALLEHLAGRQVGVAAPLRSVDGQGHVSLEFPEGTRALAVFHHAEGVVPETPDEFELTGRTLAFMHVAARNYAGPASRYTLDGQHLVGRTWDYLQAYPELRADLRERYRQRMDALRAELVRIDSGLTRVMCHGDTHGFNNHVATDAAGTKTTALFDFDDAGPGFLAYDLAVMPWSYLARKMLAAPDEVLQDRWTHYLRGYRAGGGDVHASDLAAVPLFLQLRHLWNLGEAVGRLHHWGTSVAPLDWLQKQLERIEPWRQIDLRT